MAFDAFLKIDGIAAGSVSSGWDLIGNKVA
jgi:hypothetical protein